MELDFDKVGGSAGKALKKLKPVHVVAIGGGAVALFFLVRRAGGGTSSPGVGGGGSIAADNSAVYDAMNTLSGQTSTAISEMQGFYNGQISDLQDALVSITDKSAARDGELMKLISESNSNFAKSLAESQKAVGSAVSSATAAMADSYQKKQEQDSFNSQVEAAKQIKGYSDAWNQLETSAKASGGITPEVQKQLDYYATAARTTSINAGFGVGNQDGTGRNISADVKKAAGLS